MKITLWQLNESYQALLRLAQQQFPKEHHKLAYKLSRVMKSAKVEQETLNESLQELADKCGVTLGVQNNDPEKVKDFNNQSAPLLKETTCDLWGDPFKLEEIASVASISPFDLALLDWLIVEEEEQEQKTQAATA